MRHDGNSWTVIARRTAAIIVFCAGVCSADSSPSATAASAPAKVDRKALQAQLAAAEKALADREPSLKKRLEAIPAELKDLEARRGSLSADELTERKDRLTSERAALQRELKHLESAEASWQAALDAFENAQRFRQQLAEFQSVRQRENAKFVPTDVEAFQSQLAQVRADRSAIDKGMTARAQRLNSLAEQLKKANDQTRPSLEAERLALHAAAAADRQKRAASDARRALLEAKLAAAGEALGKAVATQPTTTSTAPAPLTEKDDALNKQKLAEALEAKARDRLSNVRTRLEEIQTKLKRATDAGESTAELENDREYWQRVEAYEERRIEQAEFQETAAREKGQMAQLRERIDATRKTLEQLERTYSEISPANRQKQAARFRQQAEAARARAADLEERGKTATDKIPPLQQHLRNFDKLERAWRDRAHAATGGDFQRLFNHFIRMRSQLDAEREQIDLMIMTSENVVFAIQRQATLERELAALHARCADVLVPPMPSFWQRHHKTVSAVRIVLVVVCISYGVKLFVWLIGLVVTYLSSALSFARDHVSAKRVGTLVSFAGSIVKLFVWIFGLITILNEFGIDYAKSTGAIGLIGLIMAGMFQQIVVDFVKGLDIIAGGHYNVGDFVEVDGKFGHVIDFNVKYTRIRTVSGQELNIPNSRCVPSRRFPDGYTNNYVDVALKSSTDEARAKAVIDPLCVDLNHRVEPMRDTPALAVCFDGPQGRVVMRYRVRVLPGCDWVVKDYFIPAVKQALADEGIELAGEPTFFFINRLKTFRKLFSRELSEEEIIRQLGEEEVVRRRRDAEHGPTTDESAARPPAI